MSIRLVHVTTVPITLGFFRGQIGDLKTNGFEVTAVSSPGELLDAFGRTEQIDVVAVPISRSITPLADILSLFRLVRTLRRLQPDIVHAHTPKAGLLGTVAARMLGKYAVLSVFGLAQMTRRGLTRRLLDFTTVVACGVAHRVWCDSFSMRDYLVKQRLCPADKIFVLGSGSVNGVDARAAFNPERFTTTDRAAVRGKWSVPADALVIGFVGRVVRDKGMHELAVAWTVLRERFPNMHLMIVGEPESTDPVAPEDDAILRRDPRVHFTGRQADVAALLAAMDIFVMPSYREGFGVTNIEAAAMVLPVVATAIPGCIDSVVDGETGTLVPPRDATALATAIEAYAGDASLRLRHGLAGRRRVLEDFRPELIWSGLRSEYMRLVGRQSVGR